MIVSDTPNCGITYNRHYDDRNSFIIQATECHRSVPSENEFFIFPTKHQLHFHAGCRQLDALTSTNGATTACQMNNGVTTVDQKSFGQKILQALSMVNSPKQATVTR
jgi:hypothetical protein